MTLGRAARVQALLDAARDLARQPEGLVRDLVASTGLSPEGVRLGLGQHLETEASSDEVQALVAAAGDAPEVTVVLAANVFVAPLRALALACAAAPRVRVRASRREPVFTRALVAALAARGTSLGIELVTSLDLERLREGEVHVYGRQATLDALRPRVTRGLTFRGHGPGIGVAVILEQSDLPRTASALAADIVAFDQRGCLSPRLSLVQGDAARVAAFGRALHDALTEEGRLVPRGALDSAEREQRARYASTMAFSGHLFEGTSHLIGVAPPGGALALPPTGRHLHLAPWRTMSELAAMLSPLAGQIVAIGVDDPQPLRQVLPEHARVSPLGFMQKPRFDGPVDRRGTD